MVTHIPRRHVVSATGKPLQDSAPLHPAKPSAHLAGDFPPTTVGDADIEVAYRPPAVVVAYNSAELDSRDAGEQSG